MAKFRDGHDCNPKPFRKEEEEWMLNRESQLRDAHAYLDDFEGIARFLVVPDSEYGDGLIKIDYCPWCGEKLGL
jgi:hypothetical protein